MHSAAMREGLLKGLLGVASLSISLPALADGSGNALVHALIPSAAFLQAGLGDEGTHSYTGGAIWDSPWHYTLGTVGSRCSVDAAFGKWITKVRGQDSRWFSQFGLTTALRVRPSGSWNAWFAEIGVGANYITPEFDTGHKRFSTKFEFGDHYAIGRNFGPHEVAVRIQHFSNASIQQPNPGENFIQLRYAYHFGN